MDVRQALSPAPQRSRPTLALAVALVVALVAPLSAPAIARAQAERPPVDDSEPPPAPNSVPGSTSGIEIYAALPAKPDDFRLSAREAIEIANSDPKVAQTRATWGELEVTAKAERPDTWQIGYLAGGEERAQVLVDDPSATVRESWTGYQVEWQMARGYEGSFGHHLNAAYVWIPLCLVFFCGLADFRRPRRLAHLDLLVLLSFSASHIFFNAADIGVSVPLTYPPLAYLLARMLWLGFRGPGEGLRPTAPIAWLAIATCFLLGFRIALNVADSGVIDVGYAGVIGADRLVAGEPLYGGDAFPSDNPFGDTYGPVNYYLYVPFELVFGWSGDWDELPAGHAAALFFDLATVALLFVFGRRLRPGRAGRDLGTMLAFGWAAYPYTAFALQSNANDALVAMIVVAALIVLSSPPARGALAALAGLTKFAPFALAPVLAAGARAGLASTDPETGDRPLSPSRLRALAAFALALTGVAALAMLQTLLDPGAATFFDRTIANQVDRESPFSVWGQTPSLGWLQLTAQVAAAGLALLVAFLPRARSQLQVAALAAAVLIAVQLTADHWFYLYIVWFFPLALAALATPPPRPAAPP